MWGGWGTAHVEIRAFIPLQLLGFFSPCYFYCMCTFFELENLKHFIIENLIWSGKYSNSFILKHFAVAMHFLRHIVPGDV